MFVLMLVFFAGCAERGAEGTSQAVARVDQRELTVHELDYEMARLGITDGPSSQSGREVAISLVERTLLAEKALESEFDRDPAVLYALRSTRDQILAEAYLDRTVVDFPQPTDAQISDYYEANPDLYAQRRGYHFVEMIAGEPVTLDEVRDAIAQQKTMEALVAGLQKRDAVFATREVYATSESISVPVLTTLRQLQPSQMGTVAADDGVHAVELIGVAELPLEFEAANKQIGEMLFAQAQQRAAAAEIERLKAAAKIVWEKPYSDAIIAEMDSTETGAAGKEQIERGLEGLR